VRGEQIAFSILSNNLNVPARRITDAIDEIILNVIEDEPRRK